MEGGTLAGSFKTCCFLKICIMLTEYLTGCIVSSDPWACKLIQGDWVSVQLFHPDSSRGSQRGSGDRWQYQRKAMPSGSWKMHLQKSTQLHTSLQYHLLPLCSFPLPICARPLVSQRIYIKKKKLAWFKEKESGICGLPLPQLYLVSITSDHMARPASHTLSQGCNLVSPMGLCILLYHTVEIQLLLVFCKLPAKGFLFHFILASAACSLQKAFSENRFHKLQSPKTRNHCPFYLGTVFQRQ